MAKRFTDTEKWKKPFIRGLQGPYKLLWFYVCDDCDHSGIWQVDIEIAQIRIGEKIDLADAVKFFGEKIQVFDNGNKWFIPSFIEFQYPSGLNPLNKAHGSVIKNLEKYGLLKNDFKPLTSPLQGAMEMDMEMDKEMDKDKTAQFPIFESEFTLTETEIQAAKEINHRATGQLPTEKDIGNWLYIFKQVNFTGQKFYENRAEIVKHFKNWVKSQKLQNATNNNSTSNGNGKLGTSAARIAAISALK